MSGRPAGEAAPLRPLDAGSGFGTFAPPPPPYGDDDGGARTDPESEHAFDEDVKASAAFLEPEVLEAEFEAEIVRRWKPPLVPCLAVGRALFVVCTSSEVSTPLSLLPRLSPFLPR
jgi:hypothetical protein